MIRLLFTGYVARRPGGMETFMRTLASELPKDEFHINILSIDSPPPGVQEMFAAMNVRFFSPQRRSITKKRKEDIHTVIETTGLIDIIHCNGSPDIWHWLDGAKEVGIPVRIFHGHHPIQKHGGFFRELYIRHRAIPLLARYATHCVFCSQYVMNEWIRLRANDLTPCEVKYCGVDCSPFENVTDSLRTSLGIPEDAIVFGHVGRFSRVKNHSFLIEIFKEIAVREPRAYFLLVGSGQREKQVQRHIARLGLENRVILTGHRDDIPDLLATMNVFILPSFFEGWSLVAAEAHAVGVPSLCSDKTGISLETCLLPGMIQTLSLKSSAACWAEAAIAKTNEVLPPRNQCLEAVRNAPFELSRVTQSFADYYRRCLR